MSTEQAAGGLQPISDYVADIASHVGLTVPNLDEGRRFYCDLLGFAETATYQASGPAIDAMTGTPNVTVKTAMLEVPGGSRIQMQTFEPHGAERIASRMNDHGLTHISFGVRDVHAEYERLSAAGVHFRNPPTALQFEDPHHPMNGLDAVYFEDPWGLPLEFVGPTVQPAE